MQMTQTTPLRARGVRTTAGFFLSVSMVTAMACGGGASPTVSPAPNNMPGANGAGAPTTVATNLPAGMRSSTAGVFTTAQAAEGRDIFGLQCGSCHSPIVSLIGTNDFKSQYFGQPLWKLFKFTKAEMPQNNPGSLTDAQYTSIMAFLLQSMRLPAGSVALPMDSTALKQIRLDSAGTRAPLPRPR